MKLMFFFFLMQLPCIAFNQQKYILIHKDLQKSIHQSDTVTLSDLNSNYAAFLSTDIDSIVLILKDIRENLDSKKMNSFEKPYISFGHTIFSIRKIHYSRSYKYDISMYSLLGEPSGKLIIFDPKFTTSRNNKRLDYLLQYLPGFSKL